MFQFVWAAEGRTVSVPGSRASFLRTGLTTIWLLALHGLWSPAGHLSLVSKPPSRPRCQKPLKEVALLSCGVEKDPYKGLLSAAAAPWGSPAARVAEGPLRGTFIIP